VKLYAAAERKVAKRSAPSENISRTRVRNDSLLMRQLLAMSPERAARRERTDRSSASTPTAGA
jgi:hypothetical protein